MPDVAVVKLDRIEDDHALAENIRIMAGVRDICPVLPADSPLRHALSRYKYAPDDPYGGRKPWIQVRFRPFWQEALITFIVAFLIAYCPEHFKRSQDENPVRAVAELSIKLGRVNH